MHRSNRSVKHPLGQPPGIWSFEIFMVKFPTPGTRLPIKCHTIYGGFVIKCTHPRDWNWKNAFISRFFVLHKIELPCNDSLYHFAPARADHFKRRPEVLGRFGVWGGFGLWRWRAGWLPSCLEHDKQSNRRRRRLEFSHSELFLSQ